MIVKILGLLDILTAISFWLHSFYNIIPESVIGFFALLILIKGIFFIISEQFASVGDIFSSLIVFLSLYMALPAFIVIIITLYLLEKGVFSMF